MLDRNYKKKSVDLLLQGMPDFLHLHVLFMHVPLHLHLLLTRAKLACFAAACREISSFFQCEVSTISTQDELMAVDDFMVLNDIIVDPTDDRN
jgi:hypothetical protein